MVERMHYDEMDDRLFIAQSEDIQPVLDANKRAFEVDDKRFNKPINHVARIPMIVIDKVRNEIGVDLLKDDKALKEFLNDPENKYFRTKPGRI